MVLVNSANEVALIRRERLGRTYYLFPGGGVEATETAEAAAIREAWEELGLQVTIVRELVRVQFGDSEQVYFLGAIVGGVFGSGTGAELASAPGSPEGSHVPVWVPLGDLDQLDVRPRQLADMTRGSANSGWTAAPVLLIDSQ